MRVHFTRMLDYTRHYTEIVGGRGVGTDQNNSVPVVVASSIAQGNGSTSQTWNAAGFGGFLYAIIKAVTD